MPHIRLSIGKKLEPDVEQCLVDRLGKALNNIPEKEPKFTMIEINDSPKMYLGGVKQEDAAFVEIKYFSKFEYALRKAVAADASKAISELANIPIENVYLTINEYDTWGALGGFRDIFYTG